MTGLNSAMQVNIKNAITGEYPDYSINYSKVSRAILDVAIEGKATGRARPGYIYRATSSGQVVSSGGPAMTGYS